MEREFGPEVLADNVTGTDFRELVYTWLFLPIGLAHQSVFGTITTRASLPRHEMERIAYAVAVGLVPTPERRVRVVVVVERAVEGRWHIHFVWVPGVKVLPGADAELAVEELIGHILDAEAGRCQFDWVKSGAAALRYVLDGVRSSPGPNDSVFFVR